MASRQRTWYTCNMSASRTRNVLRPPEGSRRVLASRKIAEGIGEIASRVNEELSSATAKGHRSIVLGVMPEAVALLPAVLFGLSLPTDYGHITFGNRSQGPRGHALDPRGGKSLPLVEGQAVHLLHTRIRSGFTAAHLGSIVQSMGAREVHHWALIHQPSQDEVRPGPGYAAIRECQPDRLLFGYGMPVTRAPGQPAFANLPEIYTLPS